LNSWITAEWGRQKKPPPRPKSKRGGASRVGPARLERATSCFGAQARASAAVRRRRVPQDSSAHHPPAPPSPRGVCHKDCHKGPSPDGPSRNSRSRHPTLGRLAPVTWTTACSPCSALLSFLRAGDGLSETSGASERDRQEHRAGESSPGPSCWSKDLTLPPDSPHQVRHRLAPLPKVQWGRLRWTTPAHLHPTLTLLTSAVAVPFAFTVTWNVT
jgi:hypothetical protein